MWRFSIRIAPVLAIFIGFLLVPAMAVASDSEQNQGEATPTWDDDQENTSDAENSSPTNSTSDPEYDPSIPPAPFDGRTLALQSALSLGVGYSIFVGSYLFAFLTLLNAAFSGASEVPPGPFAALLAGTIGAPIASMLSVNWIGNRYYPKQYLGALLGMCGGLAVVGLGIGSAAFLPTTHLATLSLFTMPLLTAAGSIIGYHIQAGKRHEAALDEASSVSMSPAPFFNSSTDDVGFGLVLQARF